jgi:lactam utilization protein B
LDVKELREGDRIVARHILEILQKNQGKGMRFKDIKNALIAEGYNHVDSSISTNNHWLASSKQVTRIGAHFGIPAVREDGSMYLKIDNNEFDSMVIELGKVHKDGQS